MFDRPALSDGQIARALETHYGVAVSGLEFLALGHDANAWTFRAATGDGAVLFVKIRRRVDPVRLQLVAFLAGHGLPAVVAPRPTLDGSLSIAIDKLHLIAYPFITARVAAEVGLTDGQWTEYGRIAAALHATALPADLAGALPREAFRPAFGTVVDRLRSAVSAYQGTDPSRDQLVEHWRANAADIDHLRQRADELGLRLRARFEAGPRNGRFVPCHADLHTHNLFVEPRGNLRIFDWDEALRAPRERDLMFVMGSPIGLAPGERELRLFEAGYGPLDIDAELLAYYHVDWAVQDIAGYAKEVMLDDISPASRAHALEIYLGLFAAGGEVEVARRFDPA